MKKFIIPIILAAALGIGGGVTAVVLNKQADAELPVVTEVKCGNYYFNGDVNSGLWIEVNPDFLILKGDDIDKSLKDAIAEQHKNDPVTSSSEEIIAASRQAEFEECKVLYCTEKSYIVRPFLPEKSKSIIKVSRNNTETDSEALMSSDAGFSYNYATYTINLGLFGDFTLVED